MDLDKEMNPSKPRLNIFLAVVFLIQGIAALLPWNAIITVPHFFHHFLKGDEGSYDSLYNDASNISFMVANVLVTAMMLIPFSKRLTRIMALVSYVIVTLAFTFFLSVAILNKIPPAAFFYSTIFCIVMLGASTSIIQMFLFLHSSRLAPAFSTSMLIGQAIAGLFVSLISYFILFTASTSENPQQNGLNARDQGVIYFSIVVATCVIASVLAFFLPIMAYKEERRAAPPLVSKPAPFDAAPPSTPTSVTLSNENEMEDKKPRLSTWGVFKAIWFQALMIFLGFFVTLSVFPAITYKISTQAVAKDDSKYNTQQSLFVSLTFVVFNVFDIVGRVIPMMSSALLRRFNRSEVPSNLFLAIFSILRFSLIFLILFCDIPDKIPQLPTFIRSDFVSYLLIALLPTTGGAVAAWTFVAAPQAKVPETTSTELLMHSSNVQLNDSEHLDGIKMRPLEPSEKSIAGKIMNFSMLFGITLGIAFSNLLQSTVLRSGKN
ncbi:hypothetical protein HMI54_001784 [Coelomomyces lativittatus]|nr:hypothetical protein HMI56_000928 [Coelomomyces lativittatus]KAJ1510209.1 hypothetical protein HMI54_001784 [Coelomomyces lativittatus]KAJ1513432.1 hypothetical protein HMI55_005579 [Coelomomyces lativittatus]